MTEERHEREKTMQREKRTKEILTIKNKKTKCRVYTGEQERM